MVNSECRTDGLLPKPALALRYHAVTMPSERVQRRIDRLLDQIDEAEVAGDWTQVKNLALDVLKVDGSVRTQGTS